MYAGSVGPSFFSVAAAGVAEKVRKDAAGGCGIRKLTMPDQLRGLVCRDVGPSRDCAQPSRDYAGRSEAGRRGLYGGPYYACIGGGWCRCCQWEVHRVDAGWGPVRARSGRTRGSGKKESSALCVRAATGIAAGVEENATCTVTKELPPVGARFEIAHQLKVLPLFHWFQSNVRVRGRSTGAVQPRSMLLLFPRQKVARNKALLRESTHPCL